MHAERLGRVRAAMAELDVEVLLLSVGADLPWLIGYEAMPLERLTMLVVPADGPPRWSCPASRRPAWSSGPSSRSARGPRPTIRSTWWPAWPVRPARVAIGDRTWAQFVLGLQHRMPGARFGRASEVTGPLRAVKDAAEIEALARAGAAVDRIAAALQAGEIPLVGRTEAEVSADLGRRILAEGHHRVNFAIVGAGENAASPHHEAGRPGHPAATRSCCATSAARC